MAQVYQWISPSTLITCTHMKPDPLNSSFFNSVFQVILMDLSRKLIICLKKNSSSKSLLQIPTTARKYWVISQSYGDQGAQK